MLYELDLSEEEVEKIRGLAMEQGIPEDECIRDIVNQFLLKSNSITRFVAKKGPNKSPKATI